MKTQRVDVDLKLWFDGEVWRYKLHERRFIGTEKVAEKQLEQGFSDDFDELLSEALAEARQHAEVLRNG